MCVVSMIYDWGKKELDPYKDWRRDFPDLPIQPDKDYRPALDLTDPVVREMQRQLETLQKKVHEIEELLRLAAEYDKRNNQPDCESEAKKKSLKELADQLGVEIRFP